jgi:hypothetical protein
MRSLPAVAKVLSLAIFAAFASLLLERPGATSQAPHSAFVRGFIAAQVGGSPFRRERKSARPFENIYLPNVKVTLLNAATRAVSGPVTTDLSGRFTLRVPDRGRYQVCWEAAGFRAGCEERIVSVDDDFVSLNSTVQIPLALDEGKAAVYGTVTLADGSSPRSFDPLANVNAFATVSLLDSGGGTLYETPVNNNHRYLLPSVALGRDLQVRVRLEGYDSSQPLRLVNPNAPTRMINVSILNAPPSIEPLLALDSAKLRVSNAAPGQTVTLNARISDRDRDGLRFLWQVSSGTLSSATEREPRWTLPSTPGHHLATLTVYDGRGGYAKSSLKLTIDPEGLVFSGTVSGTDAPRLEGAEVDVNGKRAVTDSRGFFRLHVPDKRRFVLTIRKPGYAFVSNIYYDGIVGGRWRLTKASVFNVDPAAPIDLTNTRSEGECPGPPSERLNWREHPRLGATQFQDGRGGPAATNKTDHCPVSLPITREPIRTECPPGVRVQIPANGLVDKDGNAPAGPVSVQLSTVDLQSPEQMPGNYTVLMSNNRVRSMQSYGATTVEVYSGGTKYNLRPGAEATITLPVDPSQVRSGGPIPRSIPFLTYDEARGVWLPDGTAKLETDGGRRVYVAKVTHFTAFNTDLIKTDQSCLAVQNINMPPTFDLEVTIPQEGSAAPVKRLFNFTGGNTEQVILNLPKQTNIVLVPIRTDSADPNQNGLPMGVFVVNTGAPQNMAWPTVAVGFQNEPEPPYYHETNGVSDGPCSTKVELTDGLLNFYPALPPTGAFLHGLGAFAAVNLSDTDPAFAGDADQTLRQAVEQASQDYRNQIDPRGLRPTLSCFKAANGLPLKPGESCPQHAAAGFTPPAVQTEVSAVYANTVDLGFGREMHCAQNGSNVACYVSNYDSLQYTGPGQGPDISKAQLAVQGFNGAVAPDATVAMEFSPVEDDTPDGSPITASDPEQVVKFYVFNGAGNPVNKANLDGYGDRPVPQLCMVCHGGFIPNAAGLASTGPPPVNTPVFTERAHVKLNAKFLPFDLRSFSYAAPDSDAANPFNKLNQQDEFRALNQMVKIAPPPDGVGPTAEVIEDLFDTWYPGNVSQQENVPVPLWNINALHANEYDKVVASSCRTCHVANPANTLRFEQPGLAAAPGFDRVLGQIQQRVCKEHVMPHARRTHDLFWTSINPSAPAQLQVFGDVLNIFGWQKVGVTGLEDPLLVCGPQQYTAGGGAPTPSGAFAPVATVFSARCTGCHNTDDAPAGLDLSGPGAYDRIVNVNSTEFPSMKLIEFGASTEANSYLWRKISGTHTALGPNLGGPMPCCATPLTTSQPAEADTIRNWILNGALP